MGETKNWLHFMVLKPICIRSLFWHKQTKTAVVYFPCCFFLLFFQIETKKKWQKFWQYCRMKRGFISLDACSVLRFMRSIFTTYCRWRALAPLSILCYIYACSKFNELRKFFDRKGNDTCKYIYEAVNCTMRS